MWLMILPGVSRDGEPKTQEHIKGGENTLYLNHRTKISCPIPFTLPYSEGYNLKHSDTEDRRIVREGEVPRRTNETPSFDCVNFNRMSLRVYGSLTPTKDRLSITLLLRPCFRSLPDLEQLLVRTLTRTLVYERVNM